MNKHIKAIIIILLAVATNCLCACFPKGYTAAQENERIAKGIAIARVYSEKYNPSVKLKENTFEVIDYLPNGDYHRMLSDWVKGEYTDSGRYKMMINTETLDIYSDKGLIDVGVYGEQLTQKLYGIDDPDKMLVSIETFVEVPCAAADPASENMQITDMIRIGDGDDKRALKDVFFKDGYGITYFIVVNEDVDMEPFKTLDISSLGENVRVIVRQFSSDVYREKYYHRDMIPICKPEEAEALLELYDSNEKDNEPDGQ